MKKTLNILKTIVTWVLIVISITMMVFTIVSVSTFDRDNRNLFGYKIYIVKSDSMSTVDGDESQGYFSAGDIIFVKEVDCSTLEEGDIISYISTNSSNYGETITHMIRCSTLNDEGEPGFITYGTSTGENDENVVTYAFILGKYTGHIPKIGTFFQFLKTPTGYIVFILLPFLLIIGNQSFNSIRLYRKYKNEQNLVIAEKIEKERETLKAELEAIEAERRRQDEIIRKLLELQEKQENLPNNQENTEISQNEDNHQ